MVVGFIIVPAVQRAIAVRDGGNAHFDAARVGGRDKHGPRARAHMLRKLDQIFYDYYLDDIRRKTRKGSSYYLSSSVHVLT